MNIKDIDKVLFRLASIEPVIDSAALTAGLEGNQKADDFAQGDWQYLLDKSAALGIAPIIYKNIKSLALENLLPQEVLAKFRDSYLYGTGRNERFIRNVKEILRIFGKRGIKALPLKAASLMINYDIDIGLRPTLDIDILIDRKDAVRACEALREAGYKKVENSHNQTTPYPHHHILRNEDALKFPVELHEGFFRWFTERYHARIKIKDVLERAVEVERDGTSQYKMETIDELLFSAASYYSNNFTSIRYLIDLDTIVKRSQDGIDWDEAIERIIDWDIADMVIYAFSFARTYLESRIPDRVVDFLMSKGRFDKEVLYGLPDIVLKARALTSYRVKKLKYLSFDRLLDKIALLNIWMIWHIYKRTGLFKEFVKNKSC